MENIMNKTNIVCGDGRAYNSEECCDMEASDESSGVLGRIQEINRTLDCVYEHMYYVRNAIEPILSDDECTTECSDKVKSMNGKAPMYYALDMINVRCKELEDSIRRIGDRINL
jgi:hypothetical protein